MLRYLPDVPIWVVAGEERNMKVTDPIDVYLADKLFQLATHDCRPRRTAEEYRATLVGKTMVVFGGSYGIGADIAALAASYGATVCAFSRSATGTHVERREDVAKAAAGGARRARPGRLRGEHRRRCCRAATWSRPRRRRSTPRPR